MGAEQEAADGRTAGSDTATEATWEWHLYPRSTVGRLLVPVIAQLWLGYARGVLEQLAEEVVRPATP